MASLNAKVLTRVDEVHFGSVGAAKAACTDMGSCRAFTMQTSVTENMATDASAADAVVAVAFSEQQGTATFIFEDITKENLAACLGGTVDGANVYFAPTGTPTYRTAYVTGYEHDGAASEVKLNKFYIKPGTTINLNKEQQLLEVEATLMVDADGKMFEINAVSTDTTAPTFSCVPADAATGVTVSANIVVTASEAIRSDDVNGDNFFVIKSDGTAVAATVTFDGTDTVTINPDSNLASSTAYIAVVNSGVRDIAGNKGARAVFNFQTA